MLSGRTAMLAAICIALNVGLGKVANLIGLPFTMDTIGTILAAALVPWPIAILVGISSSLIGSILIHPAFLFYTGTQVAIAITAILLVRFGGFKRVWAAAIAGLGIGIVSAAASAPVTAMVFGGISVPSITALNALFLASGETLWRSVIQGALIVESIDKVAASIIVWSLLKRLPSAQT